MLEKRNRRCVIHISFPHFFFSKNFTPLSQATPEHPTPSFNLSSHQKTPKSVSSFFPKVMAFFRKLNRIFLP
ncbi:hypothetical protein MtrunA17_Chr2g0313341 [Medicago truncatula]|uniref:Uncharacterized protein n=1 Tax=Medicago truncatula TaxID=3880 RepID=A0A396J8X1_MEDTR|nr:hypothetical protein MtrunA17_Chr2g0313341 [Medicago truncatula]